MERGDETGFMSLIFKNLIKTARGRTALRKLKKIKIGRSELATGGGANALFRASLKLV